MGSVPSFGEAQRSILGEVSKALDAVAEADVAELVSLVMEADKVFFVGVGRVLLSLEAFAKRLGHLGVSSVVVGQITEPAITTADLLIVGSGSGESIVPLAIVRKAKQLGARVVHIGSNPNSSMREYADHFLRIPTQTKLGLDSEVSSVQPMTSLFEQCLLILADAVALMVVRQSQVDLRELWRLHANLE